MKVWGCSLIWLIWLHCILDCRENANIFFSFHCFGFTEFIFRSQLLLLKKKCICIYSSILQHVGTSWNSLWTHCGVSRRWYFWDVTTNSLASVLVKNEFLSLPWTLTTQTEKPLNDSIFFSAQSLHKGFLSSVASSSNSTQKHRLVRGKSNTTGQHVQTAEEPSDQWRATGVKMCVSMCVKITC